MISFKLFFLSIIIGGIFFTTAVSSESFDYSKLEEKIDRVFIKYFNDNLQTINQTQMKQFLDHLSKNIELRVDLDHHSHDHNEADLHPAEHHENLKAEEILKIKNQCFEKSLRFLKDSSKVKTKTDFNWVSSFIIASIDECSDFQSINPTINSSNVFFDEKRKTSNCFISYLLIIIYYYF